MTILLREAADPDTALTAEVWPLGATLARLQRGGRDVILPRTAGDAAAASAYLGALVGRVPGRIGGATFILDGHRHHVDANEGTTCLHGGAGGFAARDWEVVARSPDAVTLQIVSPDGDQGFPGTVTARCTYTLRDGVLVLDLAAETTAPTPFGLAQHAYWCLDDAPMVAAHRLRVAADGVLETGAGQVPTGRVLPLDGHVADFRATRDLGDWASLDHTLTLPGAGTLRPVAWLAGGGLTLEVATTEASLQVYGGAHLPRPGAGVALETQPWPDAVNHPSFPDAVLRPGRPWTSRTEFRLQATASQASTAAVARAATSAGASPGR